MKPAGHPPTVRPNHEVKMSGKRSIFEEVGAEAKAPPIPQGGMIDGPRRGRTPVRYWLVAIFLLVAAMILVGGLTRLTDSGLSITEWKPLTGASAAPERCRLAGRICPLSGQSRISVAKPAR